MNGFARIEVTERDRACVVRIIGEIDVSNAGEIGSAIREAVPNGTSEVLVDLGGVEYLDSSGVQVLFQLVERLRSRRQDVRMLVPQGAPIRAVLELTGLPALVPLDGGPGSPGSPPAGS